MITLALLAVALPQSPAVSVSAPAPLHFERQTLSSQFLCEGAAFGDLDGDGDLDVASGPWWYEGPGFDARHALYPARQFPRLRYSDNFFAWILDLDGDGRNDVFSVGFPGEDAWWLRNTGDPEVWEKHVVFQGVDNESPAFVDITGDGRPELVCQNQDRLGWLQADWSDPRKPWTFRVAFPQGAGPKFTHGLGVGDIDGDGRPDIVRKDCWLSQPADLAGEPAWTVHPFPFTTAHGGAQMLVTDVDGDGDADIVTANAAHGWGLSWFEQRPGRTFVEHELLPKERAPGNVSELHALALADLDGDGLQDIVTGKRWWSHGPTRDGNADGANDPAILLGLLLRRDRQGARYEVVVLDEDSGVGTQVTTGDVDGDGRCDVVVGNKRGTFVLLQRGGQGPAARGGPDLTFESGTLRGWTAEGAAFTGQPVRGDLVKDRRDETSDHAGDYWIGGFEIQGDGAQGTLTSDPFTVTGPWATFLIGGGASPDTRVEVLDAGDGALLSKASGSDRESMERVLVDLGAQVGKQIRVRLVDQATNGWGHLNFDDFQFHDEPMRGLVPDPVVGRSPAAAAAAMTTPAGFHVDLIAGEPDLHQPVALWIDERGRLWVAEAYSYPTRREDQDARDAIVVFEDQDADGTYEKRTVFYDRLNLVSGLATGFGGVWVGAAPYLMFIPDRDGDLVPDGEPEVLLDGWGYEDTHETLNSFIWGPDGWLYGTHGVFTHSRVGKPGTPDDQRVPMNCGVFRFHPQRRTFEVFAWGTSNPWGVDFDDRGEAFLTACVIPHLWHMVQGGRYHRQGGQHFDPHPWIEIETIADHHHYEGKVGDHAWWSGRNRAIADPDTDVVGGGHAHCGALVYKADTFPAEYRNAILMHNVHGNRVNQDRIERRGSGYTGHHAPDLLRANDPWFRGVALRQGAAGEVFFIDWYDKSACHRTRAELWDRSNGRLYRLRHGEVQPTRVALDELSDGELVALQADRNDFFVGHARRLLQERGTLDAGARAALGQMARSDAQVTVRLRAMWALHVTGGIADRELVLHLQDPEADVRAWAIRLAMEQPERCPGVAAALPALARSEPAPAVRLALASALQRRPLAARWDLATALLARAEDDADHNIPTVLWYGIEPLAKDTALRFLGLAESARIERVRRLMWRRLGIGSDAERNVLCTALERGGAPTAEILEEFAAAVREKAGSDAPSGWAKVAPGLLGAADPVVRDRSAEIALAFGDQNLMPLFRARLTDRTTSTERRIEAIDGLVRLRDPKTGPLLLDALAEPALRRPALAGLAAYELPETPARILAILGDLDPIDREVALGTLCARPSYARTFLDAVARGQASARLLDAASLRRQLLALGDPAMAGLLQKAWGRAVPPSAAATEEIARYKKMLTPAFLAAADKSQGRAIFARTCQACHQLYGQGGVLGPDITGSNRSDLDYLLSNIIEPSAEMGREYQLVTLRLSDGRLLAGNLIGEVEQTLTLRTVAGNQIIRRRDLAKDTPDAPAIEYAEMSLMPPGQLQVLTQEEARDLIAYLRDNRQAPIAASPENLGSFFNGRDLQGWDANPEVWSVADGQLVGRTTAGLQHNDFARSDLLLADFRLILEVQLTPDTANSGVQFRSEVLEDGAVKGYQADIGKDWWGLLYEEHGRAVLQQPSAQPARPGEWNTYEILATGDRIQLAINGVRTVDFTDPRGSKRGIIAPQVHSGGATEVRFRSFRLELDPKPVLTTVR